MKFEVHLDSVGGKTKHIVDLEKEGSSYKVSLDGQPVDADVILAAPNAVSVISEWRGIRNTHRAVSGRHL